jgi:predicted nucleic acid-binding protein
VTILDTNVLSETMAAAPSEIALAWISSRRRVDNLFITTITMAEVLYGIAIIASGKRRDKLSAQAEGMFAEDFSGHILMFDEAAARAFSQIAAARRKQGKPIAEMDAQIAAIARVHGALLATRNTADFEDCGVRLVNPWRD